MKMVSLPFEWRMRVQQTATATATEDGHFESRTFGRDTILLSIIEEEALATI